MPASETGVRQAGPDLRLAIYPGADGELTLYDGTRLSWQDAPGMLVVADSPAVREVSANLMGYAGLTVDAREPGGAPLLAQRSDLNGHPADARVSIAGPGAYTLTWSASGPQALPDRSIRKRSQRA